MSTPRTTVMTGASRGLGWHAAVTLLASDPDRHLIVTTRDSAGLVARALAAASGNPNVSEVACDLSSLASVSAAAQHIRQQQDGGVVPPIDVVMANAGTQLTTTTQTSADGIEMTFAVNVLANFALIQALAPALSVPARIVVTTSDTHFGDLHHNLGMVPAPRWQAPEQLATPGTAKGAVAYSTSKLAVIYLVHALARRLPSGIDVYSFNPGLVPGTGLARDRNLVSRIGWNAVMPMMTITPLAMSATKAGQLLAAAATGPRPGDTGAYIDRRHVVPSSAQSYDQHREQQLWDTATTLLHRYATSNS